MKNVFKIFLMFIFLLTVNKSEANTLFDSLEKNFLISQFNLLSSIGRLTAKQLNLKK